MGQPEQPSPGSLIGPYRLGEVLGEGAVGVVYLAEQAESGNVVALKLLRPALLGSDDFQRRFLREAQIARRVRHERLVPVLDVGEAGSNRYLAMAYVDGGSLQARLDGQGRLAVEATLALVADVAAGLDALHANGLIHRDVKPGNVLISSSGTALLTDFGLARGEAHTVLTRPGQIVGTPHYLAPEVIRGEPAQPASDVYALACVTYACLVGEPPFPGNNPFEVTIAHLEDEPPDPVERGVELRPAASIALRAAMAKAPGDRPTSARALALGLWQAARPNR